MITTKPLPAIKPLSDRKSPTPQLVLWSTWQDVFPQNWKRISNRKLNEACEQVEIIYGLDFEFDTLFDNTGKSLFFVDMYYDASQQRIRQAETSLALTKEMTLIPDTDIRVPGYWLEGVQIKTLSDFIDRFAQLSGQVPVWKPKVWNSLAELRDAIVSHTASA